MVRRGHPAEAAGQPGIQRQELKRELFIDHPWLPVVVIMEEVEETVA